jgi:hypothetical protein
MSPENGFSEGDPQWGVSHTLPVVAQAYNGM